MKKIAALLLALCMVFALVACGNTNNQPGTSNPPVSNPGSNEPAKVEHKGTIIWLANITDGTQYEACVNYMEAVGAKLGYDIEVVYGDTMNDAANNLLAVQNSMTDDVVGLVATQDGGLATIMEQYPDLWVCGYNSDLRSVYEEGGANAACKSNPKFLGSIADGYAVGTQLGINNANYVIEQGYKKVAIVNFPPFAYPSLTEATISFTAAIEEYNKTASEPIEIVGEATTLMFEPLPEQWFAEEGHSDLDAIVALCHGVNFVYPVMKSAMANGTCSPDTVLVSGGFDAEPSIVADIGEGRTIARLEIYAAENPGYAMILIDKAITGTLPADFENICIDSYPYTIDSIEDIENVMSKSLVGTADPALAQITVDEIVAMAQDAAITHAAIIEKFHSEQLSVDVLKNR